MVRKCIVEDKQENTKQLNARVNYDVLTAFEKVRDEVYLKNGSLNITSAIEDVLIEATKEGTAWLSKNASRAIDEDKRKILANRKERQEQKRREKEANASKAYKE